MDFAKDSPFAVGVRYAKLGPKGLESAVYYPIDKEKARNDGLWLRNPEKTQDAMETVFGPLFPAIPCFPRFVLRSYTSIKFPVTENADLASKYASGQTTMRPVIFSHGLSGDKSFYQVIYLYLAAQGYLVIAFNHQDESCFYTEDKDGNDLPYKLNPFYIAPLRKSQVAIRISEVM